jgi:hypothetical protein
MWGCLHAGNKHSPNLVLAGTIDEEWVTFNGFDIVVDGIIAAHSDDFRFELERRVTSDSRVKRVGDNRSLSPLHEAKTRMTVPKDFHQTSNNR